MQNIHEITLKIYGTYSPLSLFNVVQGDKNTRIIRVYLINDDGSAYDPGSGVTAEYWSQKPDGNGTSHSATLASNVVTVTLTEQDTAAVGMVYATIRLKTGSQLLATIPFNFKCVKFPLGNDVESTSEYQTLIEATEEAEQAIEDTEAATVAANAAADYATDAADTASNYNVDLLAEGYDTTKTYNKDEYCIHEGSLYRCTVDITAPEAWTASHWLAVELGADVEDAWKDATEGYSDTLTAGDLTSDEYQTDDEPYLFRRTYGGANNHAMDTLVGGTVAWNQLYNTHTTYQVQSGDITGLTITVEDGFIDISGTASANALINVFPRTAYIPANHVCLILCDGWNGFRWQRAGFRVEQQSYYMNKHDMDFMGNVRISIESGSAYSIHARFSTFDLTQMFGTTIADAIYAMEQAESGSGVAWFRKYFPESYYAYDSGTLKSVEAIAHRMVGKNLLSNLQEGIYTGNGVTAVVKNGICTLSGTTTASGNAIIIPLDKEITIPNETCYIHLLNNVVNANISPSFELSSDPNNTNISLGFTTINRVYQVPTNRHGVKIDRVRFYIANGIAVSGVFSPMICFTDTSDTFKPYRQNTYKLSPLTLRGITKLVDGKLQYDGDTYEPSGQVVRRYGVVDLGTLTWTTRYTGTTKKTLSAPLSSPFAVQSFLANMIFSAYSYQGRVNGAADLSDPESKDIGIYSYANGASTPQSAIYAVIGVNDTVHGALVYELATPTTEQASPYEPIQVVYADGTEEYISQNIVPVGHVTKYPVSIKQALTQIAKAPSSNGTYVLKCVVTDGVASYSWVTE